MPGTGQVPPSHIVRIKRKHVERLCANEEKIRSFFGVDLEPVVRVPGEDHLYSASVASYKVVPVQVDRNSACNNNNNTNVRKEDTGTSTGDNTQDTMTKSNTDDLAKRVQVGSLIVPVVRVYGSRVSSLYT